MKILLLKFRNIGDVLLCTPLVSNLRHHYPNAQIEFCVNKETEAMLTLNPNINRIITYDRVTIKSFTRIKRLWREFDFIRSFYKEDYDLVITLS